jgi:hypothetical protein
LSRWNDACRRGGIPLGTAPSILNRSYTITAEVKVPEDGGDGMIVTAGGRWGGFGLYMLKGKPVFNYNGLLLAQFRAEGSQPLSPGKHSITFEFTVDGPGIAKGGNGVLKTDGEEVAKLRMPKTIPFLLPVDETFDVGLDTRTGVKPGLPGAVPVQRHDRQADLQAWTSAAVGGGTAAAQSYGRVRSRVRTNQ